MRYEAIIFDKDGVLVDTEPFYDRRRREFFAEVGIDDSAFPAFTAQTTRSSGKPQFLPIR